jgi:hypothetical protein
MIARTFENHVSCLPAVSNAELIDSFNNIERRTNLFRTLSNLRKSSIDTKFKTNTILIFRYTGDTGGAQLELKTFDTVGQAIDGYNALEKEMEGKADIVLVRAENADSIKGRIS